MDDIYQVILLVPYSIPVLFAFVIFIDERMNQMQFFCYRKYIMYLNTEVKYDKNGEKMVREVRINGGKGYKSITNYKGKRKHHTVRKPIKKSHIKLIQKGCFVPGLFSDCIRKTHKNKRV